MLLAWPLAQHIITQGWYYNDGSAHRAIDMRAAVGTAVYAAEDGTVDTVQTWDGKTKTGMQSYGNMVRIKHTDYKSKTLMTRYAHLSKISVNLGNKVKKGDLIGFAGNTGNSFGSHLHFEVIQSGTRTNPLVWLDDDFTTASSKVFTFREGEHSVAIPEDETKKQLQKISIGPVSNGDAWQIYKLCQKLDILKYYKSEYVEG